MLIRFKIVVYFSLFLFILSCKKENIEINNISQIEWIKVLPDSLVTSTDSEGFQALNGKVLTDQNDNIIFYFYSRLKTLTQLSYCNKEGTEIWKKQLQNFVPLEMIQTIDQKFVIAGYDSLNKGQGIKLYRFDKEGIADSSLLTGPEVPITDSNGNITGSLTHTFRILYSCQLISMPDNSLRISGAFMPDANPVQVNYFGKISASFQQEWCRQINYFSSTIQIPSANYDQHSLMYLGNDKFLFQWAIKGINNSTDSTQFGISYGILKDGPRASFLSEWIDTINYIKTGVQNFLTGNNYGKKNRYANGFIKDNEENYIYHFSAPDFLGSASNNPSAGFVKINPEGEITDTIPIPLSTDYRIISCTKNKSKFLLIAYKINILSGSWDFKASQTLFLIGGNDWQTNNSFTFQQFYSDFFSSAAPTSDGGFVLFGKIQSFNGPSNKIAIVKINPN